MAIFEHFTVRAVLLYGDKQLPACN